MNNTLENLYQTNLSLFESAQVSFQQWQHEPILDFATDDIVAERLGWTGTQSKSLFLKIKGGGYALFLTERHQRLDSKAIKALVGKRVSICGDDEMVEQLACLPGAVCPFGLPEHVIIVVDSQLLEHEELLYTPGKPDFTIGFAASALPELLKLSKNTVHYLAQ